MFDSVFISISISNTAAPQPNHHLHTIPANQKRPKNTKQPYKNKSSKRNVHLRRPGTGVKIGRPNPPARGSFPLDHDAECQPIMKQYLRCLKTARGVNSPECRELSKGYLNCRMERGLMAPDEMKNLGYAEGQTVTDDVGKGRKK